MSELTAKHPGRLSMGGSDTMIHYLPLTAPNLRPIASRCQQTGFVSILSEITELSGDLTPTYTSYQWFWCGLARCAELAGTTGPKCQRAAKQSDCQKNRQTTENHHVQRLEQPAFQSLTNYNY